jgi:hypothetical protein
MITLHGAVDMGSVYSYQETTGYIATTTQCSEVVTRTKTKTEFRDYRQQLKKNEKLVQLHAQKKVVPM